jgi:hypothetical protein
MTHGYVRRRHVMVTDVSIRLRVRALGWVSDWWIAYHYHAFTSYHIPFFHQNTTTNGIQDSTHEKQNATWNKVKNARSDWPTVARPALPLPEVLHAHGIRGDECRVYTHNFSKIGYVVSSVFNMAWF